MLQRAQQRTSDLFSSLLVALLLSGGLLGCADAKDPERGRPDEGPADAGIDAGGSPGYGTLGATLQPSGDVAFRLFSSRATRIVLQLFAQASDGPVALERVLEREPGAEVWSRTVTANELAAAGLSLPLFYGYRLWGPNWPWDPTWTPGSSAGFVADVDSEGNRFNPNKLLVDPYAKELTHDPSSPQHTDHRIYWTGESDRRKDSGAKGPKGIVLPAQPTDVGHRPTRAFKDDVIYEVHLRGLTKGDHSLAEPCRGTYAAAAAKADYLKGLGVTAVEFLPLHETQNATNDLTSGTEGDNYWGYSSLSYFAPDRRYACDTSPGGPTRELREMVKAYHARGLKVFVDVVYNHSAEGSPMGNGDAAALLSLRGFDNAAYYQVKPGGRWDRNDNGVSSNLHTAYEVVRTLVLDSLRYWHEELGVDGFRFDLASVLGNGCTGDCFEFAPGDSRGILQRAVAELPARPEAGGAGVELIAEPWAASAGTYTLGRYPKGWSEWNGQYRDTLRRDQNRLGIDAVSPRQLVARLTGSADLMGAGRSPSASVNFLVAHDGFSLKDLYSCNERRNDLPWPFGPSSGGESQNLSWDHGGQPAAQRQAARTGLALLALSAGVPMLTGGDEMLRTQYCNNNPYNLDSEKNWLDWSFATTNAGFLQFSRQLFAFRHAHPALRVLDSYRTGDRNSNGLKGLTVLTDTGAEATDSYLDNPANQFVALQYELAEFGEQPGLLYVGYNGWDSTVRITLPPVSQGKKWYRVADTAAWYESAGSILAPGAEEALAVRGYDLHPRSLLILIDR